MGGENQGHDVIISARCAVERWLENNDWHALFWQISWKSPHGLRLPFVRAGRQKVQSLLSRSSELALNGHWV